MKKYNTYSYIIASDFFLMQTFGANTTAISVNG